jgi:GxxExxY protein
MRVPTAIDTGINGLSTLIIGCRLIVAHTLGPEFVEKIRENVLDYELRKRGFAVAQQGGVVVRHDGVIVREYTMALLVEGVVLVELKAAKALDDIHLAQCLNYLKTTGPRL